MASNDTGAVGPLIPEDSPNSGFLGKLFPADPDTAQLLSPEEINYQRRGALGRLAQGLFAAAAPAPQGTTNIWSRLAGATQGVDFAGHLREAAQQSVQLQQLAMQMESRKAVQDIVGKNPPPANASPEDMKAWLSGIIPDLLRAGPAGQDLLEKFTGLGRFFAEARPTAEQVMLTHEPGPDGQPMTVARDKVSGRELWRAPGIGKDTNMTDEQRQQATQFYTGQYNTDFKPINEQDRSVRAYRSTPWGSAGSQAIKVQQAISAIRPGATIQGNQVVDADGKAIKDLPFFGHWLAALNGVTGLSKADQDEIDAMVNQADSQVGDSWKRLNTRYRRMLPGGVDDSFIQDRDANDDGAAAYNRVMGH